MASGVLVYSNGLKGTQPVHISNGGSSVTFVGEPQIPQMLIDRTATYNSVTFPFYSPIKRYIIKKENQGTYGAGTAGTCTFNSKSVQKIVWTNSSLNTTWAGEYYLVDQTTALAITNTQSGTISLYDVISSHKVYDKSNATLTIKKGANEETLSNITGFAAFGTEYDSTEYTNISSDDNANYNSMTCAPRTPGATFTETCFKFESIENYQKIAVGLKGGNAINARVGYAGGGGISFYLWNFNTSAWVSITQGITTGSDDGGHDDLTGHPAYSNILDSTNYINSGVVYGKIVISGGSTTTDSVTSKLSYISLLGYNPMLNTIKP